MWNFKYFLYCRLGIPGDRIIFVMRNMEVPPKMLYAFVCIWHKKLPVLPQFHLKSGNFFLALLTLFVLIYINYVKWSIPILTAVRHNHSSESKGVRFNSFCINIYDPFCNVLKYKSESIIGSSFCVMIIQFGTIYQSEQRLRAANEVPKVWSQIICKLKLCLS